MKNSLMSPCRLALKIVLVAVSLLLLVWAVGTLLPLAGGIFLFSGEPGLWILGILLLALAVAMLRAVWQAIRAIL